MRAHTQTQTLQKKANHQPEPYGILYIFKIERVNFMAKDVKTRSTKYKRWIAFRFSFVLCVAEKNKCNLIFHGEEVV